LATLPESSVAVAVPAPAAPAAAGPIVWTDAARRGEFDAWLAEVSAAHGLQPHTLRPASADASFRRYFRLDRTHCDGDGYGQGQGSLIVMDAPPALEDCHPFVHVAGLLGAAGLNAPQVRAWDEARGFMLLTDLGERTYLAELQSLDLSGSEGLRRADALYRDAIDALIRLQGIDAQGGLPTYDRERLQREMSLFPDWYIARHHRLELDERERSGLERCLGLILDVCTAQPVALVHRDFHSRNLMLPTAGAQGPGILDFQDAVVGPVTYDLVSLLRDAYIEWDEAIQIDWAARYWERARKAGVPVQADFGSFWRDFEWMGLQRHLRRIHLLMPSSPYAHCVSPEGAVSAVVAGFVAVLVGFTSSVVIVFQAAQALGATPAQTTSWMWALGLGMGISSAGLSLRYRQPVLTAWSTPGAALLAPPAPGRDDGRGHRRLPRVRAADPARGGDTAPLSGSWTASRRPSPRPCWPAC
jgi:aminoglycoside/choline kinase family phosphotransferase